MQLFHEIWGFVRFIVEGTIVAVVDLFIMYARAGCVWRQSPLDTAPGSCGRLAVQLAARSPAGSRVSPTEVQLVVNEHLVDRGNRPRNSAFRMTAVVTGVSCGGIGFFTAMNLILCGYSVLGVCRSKSSATLAENAMRCAVEAQLQRCPAYTETIGSFSVRVCDLSDTDAVRRLCEVLERDVALRIVVCNAGPMATPPRLSAQHLEEQFVTHCAGHSLLLLRLVEQRLSRKCAGELAPLRVVVVSSAAAASASDGQQLRRSLFVKHENVEQFRATWDRYRAYGNAKMCSLLFALALSRFVEQHLPSCTVNVLHPGPIRSRVLPNSGLPLLWFTDSDMSALFRLSPAIAALYVTNVAVSVRLCGVNGHFFRMGIDQTEWYRAILCDAQHRRGFLRNSLWFPGMPAPLVSLDVDLQDTVWRVTVEHHARDSLITPEVFLPAR